MLATMTMEVGRRRRRHWRGVARRHYISGLASRRDLIVNIAAANRMGPRQLNHLCYLGALIANEIELYFVRVSVDEAETRGAINAPVFVRVCTWPIYTVCRNGQPTVPQHASQ